MANTVLLKRSSVPGKAPTTANIQYGELSINYADGVLYYVTASNTINSFLSNGSSLTSNVITANTINVSGNVSSGNLNATNTLTVANITTTGTYGNITGANVISANTIQTNNHNYANGVSILSNINTGKITASGNVTTNGNLILNGPVYDVNGNIGQAGQVLASFGSSGVQWITKNTGSLSGLSDVSISSPNIQQVLTYNGTSWVNADSNATVASAVFAGSQYDMGYVYDNNVTVHEDEGYVNQIASTIYDLGVLSFTGIISLNNIDQSIKSDYTSMAIIFGF